MAAYGDVVGIRMWYCQELTEKLEALAELVSKRFPEHSMRLKGGQMKLLHAVLPALTRQNVGLDERGEVRTGWMSSDDVAAALCWANDNLHNSAEGILNDPSTHALIRDAEVALLEEAAPSNEERRYESLPENGSGKRPPRTVMLVAISRYNRTCGIKNYAHLSAGKLWALCQMNGVPTDLVAANHPQPLPHHPE
jgi:hypothetical protein